MTFELNQIFIDTYPPEAAQFCNDGNEYLIVEIEPEDEHRCFQIQAIPEPTDSEVAQNRINELQQYLSSTDWYAVRKAETGVEIPPEVAQQRQSARDEISTLRLSLETKK